ncbi:hypothetical protein EUGRSUZ_B01569 [Eucalyptus grandis]|uniref:Uncharacterized protein n=2 Tax=Eucalyptus grandis TaxID=71139 RepID=A0ACC3LQ12_EUCGR|nr:hypothetical protein EUGRSUZ_B01569 [Eucalyptus grandis]
MTTKVKGLLKGLRYISQIFDADDDGKEPEMKIGFPTDVKHVAHIGCDGASVKKNSPSWVCRTILASLSSNFWSTSDRF